MNTLTAEQAIGSNMTWHPWQESSILAIDGC
jgi:hypothetical protein